MTPIRHFPFTRSLTWVLVAAFLGASFPAPVLAQEEAPPAPEPAGAAPADEVPAPPAPAEAARERIARLRATRAGQPAAPAGEAPAGPAEVAAGPVGVDEHGEAVYQFNLVKDAPLDALLDLYSGVTGRTMIKAPGLNATFPNIKVKERLTRAEMIQVMDTLLSMNKITLVPLGTRFYRVVQIDAAATEGLAIQREVPEGGIPESDALVSQMVTMKYLDLEDANNLVKELLHGFGKVQKFDRINSLLITETATNLKRILEILDMVDQQTELNIVTRVVPIKYAKAADIAARLNELISDSQGEKKEEVPQVAQPVPAARRPASMIRARQPAAAEATPAPDTAAALEAAMAERGIIQGKVKVLADERTNILIIISKPVNFAFIDQIVAALDVPVEPEVDVQVVALEFADATEMAGLLNDFIGAAKSETETAAPAAAGGEGTAPDSRARALEEYVRARAAAADRVRQAAGEAAASKIGQLSPNTKILADERTNTLLLMGTRSDLLALRDVIAKVDIMLAQVLIEAVILEVNLNNNTAYGVKWLQKSMTAYSQRMAGPNGGVSLREPLASWGGNFGDNSFSQVAGETVTRAYQGGSGLTYFFTFADLNVDLVLDMVASSGEGRVLATPVILTTDNTEASILSGQQIPIRTGDTDTGGTVRSEYEYKDVGIQLKVKPRINPSRYVTMEITQSADTLGEPVDVGTAGRMTSINKREMTASISVPSRSTIVLGGLVQTDYQALNTRVPILGGIPLIGALFRNEDKTRKRTELLVLITPYVLMTPEEARAETERLHRASNVAAEDWYRGWSDSSLAPFSPQKLRELKREEKTARRVRLQAPAAGTASPPVAVIEPAAPMPKPTPEAQDAAAFGREVERVMSSQADTAGAEAGAAPELAPAAPLPTPEEPTPTAPFVFDPAVPAAPAEPPPPAEETAKPRKKRKARGTVAEAKPSMFPAPAEEKGDAP